MPSQPSRSHSQSPDGRRPRRGKSTPSISQPKTPSRSKQDSPQKVTQDVAGLKDYQLGDCLGKGAFGSVYRALNWGTGETVAIKQVKLADLPKSELRVIMLEIDLLKNLNHPNIVKYHGFVKSAESLYIILEYCENGSLHSICKNFGKFPENLVGLYMAQVLRGLLYLHEQGVIHRDIKGANILTTKEGLVKLADFGVATRTTGLSESAVVGTPYWMAPEIIELSGATAASDIWSLGCTVIELLDGKPPYHKLQPMHALFRIVNDDHPPLPEGTSPAARDFLMQCFQKDPNLRVSARKLLKHPWIVNARRTDSVVPTQPTKYDEAVKSVQQWNEKLKSPNAGSLRKVSKVYLPPSNIKTNLRRPSVAVPAKEGSSSSKSRIQLDTLGSEESTVENWDEDFASEISPSAMLLPHLRPLDNFGGMLSAENLKAYASLGSTGAAENWDDNFEGELTVKSPIQPSETDPLQTIRPFDVGRTAPREFSPNRRARATSLADKDVVHQGTTPKMLESSQSAIHFREDSVEDYSDLIAPSDAVFQQKVRGLRRSNTTSAKLFHPSDLENLPRLSRVRENGKPSRKKSASGPNGQGSPVKRTRSSLEIQRYAENERDEDFSDIFGHEGVFDEKSESDTGSERGTLMLNSKLSNNSWLGDEDDEDDPFEQLDGFDEMDLEANIARDKHARLCTLVEGLISSLKISQADDMLAELSEQLLVVLSESPETKNVIISAHGMLPILEILDTCTRRDVVFQLLRIVNAITCGDVEIQENLCFVGGIPILTKFASKRYPSEIRLEAAIFVRQICQSSTLTLQMFVSCGGLNVLVEFLEEDYDAEKDLVLIGVNGIWSVFSLQGPTPKNDFCRIFSRSSVLYPLSLVLNRVLDEDGGSAILIQDRIVNIFLLFSQAENHVKEMVADRMVLKRVLKDLKRMSPSHQITMLKFIKNLSMLSTTLDALQNSNAIEVLTDLLSSKMREPQFREISNQILNTMYNLCRLSKTRQEDAALNGLVPLLQRIVKTERPLKEFALPILCDMAHSGKVGRKVLWQNKGLQFYISLLADPYWQVTALDAIFIWLQEETAKVEEHLLDGSFTKAIIRCFTTSKANAFENLLEPLQKLLRLSPPVALSLARPDLFSRIVQKLHHGKAVVRLNLLRIVRSICDASDEQGGLIRRYGLYDSIKKLAESDSAVLVRNLAGELVKSSLDHAQRGTESARARNSQRTNSSNSSPIFTSSRSVPSTPKSTGTGRFSDYFDIKDLRHPQTPRLPPSLSSVQRGDGGSISSHSRGESMGSTSSSRSRLPRSSIAGFSRLSIAEQQQRRDGGMWSPGGSQISSRRRQHTSDDMR